MDKIGEGAFRYCTSLTTVTIPDSVTSIGGEAFYQCTSMTSVNIPKNVISIGSRAFYECNALTKIDFNAVEMDDISVYSYVFGHAGQNGTGVTVTIGAEVSKIPSYLFESGGRIKSVVFEAGSVCETIGAYAFTNCSKLTSISLGDCLTSIQKGAFNGCTSLTTVYYAGSNAEWMDITIATSNAALTSATIYYNTTGSKNG